MKTKTTRKKSVDKRKRTAKKESNQSIIDFLMQIVRGDVMRDEQGEMSCPTISQRISASQILLRLKSDGEESRNSFGKIGIDIPQRSTRYDEWLSRIEGKISTVDD